MPHNWLSSSKSTGSNGMPVSGRLPLVSADRDLDTAAAAEGLVAEDHIMHP